ncbi:ABC transporter permease [Planomicrobium sp. Y74]|uniref:ABC transporter permease n=1 Tax=Planomicrobium sp. Y74 TaxID=2478977 RepID=UPI000EF4CDED|nr:ABC transporter permease [Planomicrobium sp. Y74]RLQ91262.1 ABC transporter permease [Planomicrobium sp. Y74]
MRISALVKRIMLQMFRDKRTLALLFLAPLLVLTLMYLIFDSNEEEMKLGVVGGNDLLIETLESQSIRVENFESADNDTVLENDLDAILELKSNGAVLTLENDDPTQAKALLAQISQALAFQSQGAAEQNASAAELETNYIYGNEDTEFFDVIGPILVGFFVFFFVFLISGIGLLKERVSGTLERVLATPVKRWEIVGAYLIGFGIFAIIQTTIVVSFSIWILDMVMEGEVWHVIIINLMLALVALSLGILLSTFAGSEFQMVQFIPLVIVPQIFFSGIFPLDGMADWLQNLGRIMPLYYGADALKAVMYRGEGLTDVWGDLLVLGLFALLFIVLNILALKRYRKL